jgi:phosphoglycolate phosphatase-like HAD superfamily hydrolase
MFRKQVFATFTKTATSRTRLLSTNNKRWYVVFDLDGTLFDTLEDITNSANFAVQQVRKSEVLPFNQQQVRTMVGDGAKILIERMLTRVNEVSNNLKPPRPMSEEISICHRYFIEQYVPDDLFACLYMHLQNC